MNQALAKNKARQAAILVADEAARACPLAAHGYARNGNKFRVIENALTKALIAAGFDAKEAQAIALSWAKVRRYATWK